MTHAHALTPSLQSDPQTESLNPPARAATPSHHAMKRLAALDGFRAVAVAWVMAFHYFHFWTPASADGKPLLPEAPLLSALTLAPIGYMGVHFFFIISGFVILMTLERTGGLLEFAARRAARLWPPLLLCGALTMATVWTIGPETLRASVLDAVVSMTFVPPAYLDYMTGGSHAWLDGAYWSLWVEVRFYVIFGVLYFTFRRRVVEAWLAVEALTAALAVVAFLTDGGAAAAINRVLFADYVPLFTAGVCLARIHARGASALTLFGLAFAAVHMALRIVQIGVFADVASLLAAHAVVGALFYGLLTNAVWVRPFTWRPITLVGVASYLIYLLHQNFGLSLMTAIMDRTDVPALAVIAVVAVAVTLASILLHFAFELPAQRAMLNAVKNRIFHGAWPVRSAGSKTARPS